VRACVLVNSLAGEIARYMANVIFGNELNAASLRHAFLELKSLIENGS
jgi:hypothetical protein